MATTKAVEAGWIGQPPTSVQIITVLIVSVIGSLMPSILPILLDGLVQEGRLTTIQLGRAAMAELIAIAIVNGMAGAWLKHTNLRILAVSSAIVLVLANIVTMHVSGNAVLVVRAISGAGCGLFLWLLVGLLVRSLNAARWLGIYVVLLAVAALSLSSLFSTILVPKFGINGGFAALAVLCGAIGMLSLQLPKAYSEIEIQADVPKSSALLPLPGLISVIAQMVYVAGLLAVWFYVGTTARQTGNSESVINLGFSLAFVGQIVGGLLATWLGNRLSPVLVICGGGLGGILLTFIILAGGRDIVYLAAIFIYGGLWMFVSPYLLPFAIVCDPSLRSAMLATSAQLLGSAVGPALASLSVVSTDVSGALVTGICLFVLAIGCAIIASLAARRALKFAG